MSKVPFIFEIEKTEPMKYQHSYLTYDQMHQRFPKEGRIIEELTLTYTFGDSLGDIARKFENRTGWHLLSIDKKSNFNFSTKNLSKKVSLSEIEDILARG